MAGKSAWLVVLEDGDKAAQAAAAQLLSYGLQSKGMRWPGGEQGWMAAAQEAAAANAAVILVAGPAATFARPDIRRGLALFRLMAQTQLQRTLNGFVWPTGDATAAAHPRPGQAVLNDWALVAGAGWPAKVVARAHAPLAPQWPARLGLHAHERLGVWLEVHPAPGQAASGALVGVAGNDAKIDFHAVGPAGTLPERSDNQYALQGLRFEAGGQGFEAWGVRNALGADDSYYVRLEGEPDMLAIGTLPEGELQDVSLIALA